MSLPSTGSLNPRQLSFFWHPAFEKEVRKANIQGLEKGLESFELLCEVQFHPISPQRIIGPGKLHYLHAGDGWELWKIELVVKGLRQNQMPRVWFAKKGISFVYLAMGSHGENYIDGERKNCALERVSEFF